MATPRQTVLSNSLTTTIGSTVQHNGLIVFFNSYESSGAPSVTSVKLGTTSLSLAVSKVLNSGGENAIYIYYLPDIPAAQTSVVIAGTNLDVSLNSGGVCVYEVPGILTTSPFDKSNSGSATTGTTASSGATPTPWGQPNEFVVGGASMFNNIVPPSSGGWTNSDDSGLVWACGYKNVTDGSAQTYTTASTSSNPWIAAIATFKLKAANQGAFMPFIARR